MEDLSISLRNLFNQGRFSEIIQIAKSRSIVPQSSPLASQILAASLFKNGDYEDSYSILSDLESTLGEQSDYLSLYAAAARRLGKLEIAESLFNRALAVSPDAVEIRNNYANLLVDLNRLNDALVVLNKILDDNPDYPDAIFNRNRVEQLIANQVSCLDTSVTSSDDPLKVDLGDPLLLAFEQDEIDYSVKRYFPGQQQSNFNADNIPKPDPQRVASDQLRFAELALKNGDSSSALKICSKALQTFGQQARIYDVASDAYLHLNQVSQSELCLLHAVALSGKSLKRCLNLASFAMMRKNFPLAEAYIADASALDPSSDLLAKSKKLLTLHKSNCVDTYVFRQVWEEPNLRQKSE